MDFLLPALALFTLGSAMAFAYWSQKRAEKAMRSPDHKKSSLAIDGPGRAPFRQPPEDVRTPQNSWK